MKLRIRGNSIRMRVSRSEVERIAAGASCEDQIRFAGGGALKYRVEVTANGPLAAVLAGTDITLRVPRAAVDRWADPAEVSIAGEQALEDGDSVSILLEKDFACLVPRAGEDDSDLFPNPTEPAPSSR